MAMSSVSVGTGSGTGFEVMTGTTESANDFLLRTYKDLKERQANAEDWAKRAAAESDRATTELQGIRRALEALNKVVDFPAEAREG